MCFFYVHLLSLSYFKNCVFHTLHWFFIQSYFQFPLFACIKKISIIQFWASSAISLIFNFPQSVLVHIIIFCFSLFSSCFMGIYFSSNEPLSYIVNKIKLQSMYNSIINFIFEKKVLFPFNFSFDKNYDFVYVFHFIWGFEHFFKIQSNKYRMKF